MTHIKKEARLLICKVEELKLNGKNIDNTISKCFDHFIKIVDAFKQECNITNDEIFNNVENVGRNCLINGKNKDLYIIMKSNLQAIIDWEIDQ